MIVAVPSTAKPIILGGFTAMIGTGNTSWEGISGTNSIHGCNRSGLMLLENCAEHEHLIINSIFYLTIAMRCGYILSLSIDTYWTMSS